MTKQTAEAVMAALADELESAIVEPNVIGVSIGVGIIRSTEPHKELTVKNNRNHKIELFWGDHLTANYKLPGVIIAPGEGIMFAGVAKPIKISWRNLR